MKKNRYWLLAFAAITWLQLSTATSAVAAQHEHGTSTRDQVLKVGKNGDVTFSNETKVGDLVLKPARYQLQHRVDGSDHFVHFTRRGSGGMTGEAKCKLEPLGKKATQTKVYSTKENGGYRVTRVEVAGENVAHLF
ncbi:MAG: hypothetical protein AB1898_11045 [Acidobacteriota bacterium]